MFPYIRVFGIISIPLYGTIFVIGFFLAILAARRIAPNYGITREDVTYGAIYGAIGILIGSKLLYFFTKLPALVARREALWHSLENSPWDTLRYMFGYSFGGFVFYGGLFGAVYGVYRYCRRYRVPFVPFVDIFAPLIPFVHGVGRIGCFMAGCCYGREYHGFGSVQFPYNELVPALDDVPRVPVQLIEAGLNFIVCGILVYLMKKKKRLPGQLMGIYLIYYSIARFGLEMLRGDTIRGKWGMISTSQIISLLLIPIGVVLLRGKLLKKTIT